MLSESDQLKLFEDNQAMAYHCLNKVFPEFSTNKDYKQVALEGLWMACRKFDPDKGFRFSTFAYKVVENTIRRRLRDESKAIRHGVFFVSLEEPVDATGRTVGDTLQVPDFSDESCFSMDLSYDLDKLNSQQRSMMAAYVEGKTQRDIAAQHGVSQSYVSRSIDSAVRKVGLQKMRKGRNMEIEILNEGTQGIANYDKLMAWAKEHTETYKGLVVMEDGIAVAKRDVADLRKIAKMADEYRIALTREHAKKIETTVQQLKELAATFNTTAQRIDVQIKAFAEKEKNEKKEQIEAFFAENIGDMEGILDISNIWDERWLNKSVKMDAVQKAIMESIQKVRNGISAIQNMGVKYEQEMINTFVEKMDMAAAIEKKTTLEKQESVFKAEESVSMAKDEDEPKQAQYEALPEPEEPEHDEELFTLTFTVTGTKEQLIALKGFMNNNNITFKKG